MIEWKNLYFVHFSIVKNRRKLDGVFNNYYFEKVPEYTIPLSCIQRSCESIKAKSIASISFHSS